MLTEPRLGLVRKAAEAAITLGRQLDILLDAYDFYTQRYAGEISPLELNDLQISIKEIGVLPRIVADHLYKWSTSEEHLLSSLGFEINVLNEFSIHMHAIASCMIIKGIDLVGFDAAMVGNSFTTLRAVNKRLG